MRWFNTNPNLLLLLHLFTLFSPSINGADTLTPAQPLSGNRTLVSSDGRFALGFFTPANSKNRYVGMWYNKVTVQTIIWVANRRNPITDGDSSSPGNLSITANGSLTVTDRNSSILWSTPGTSFNNPVAQLLDDGNLVVKEADDSSGSFGWQSFDHPTDTLLSGMKIGVDFKRGLHLNLTAWKSDSDPSPGNYYVTMDPAGDPELYLWSGSTKVWRSGPWVGTHYSGIPETTTYKNFTFSFINNRDEITYSVNITDPSILSRLTVNQSGQAQRSVWLDGAWNTYWYAPKDQCDQISKCGPYGVCDVNQSPICGCLPGFTPRFPANWALRDGSGGCVRKTGLDCRNGTDGFATVAGAKLPDTSSCTVDQNLTLDQCRALCLSNCSCTAYASAMNGGDGSGCIIWSTDLTDMKVYPNAGQDLYVRLAAADVPIASQSQESGPPTAAIIAIAVLAAFLLLSAGYCMWRNNRRRRGLWRNNRRRRAIQNIEESSGRNDLELPLFDLDVVAAATDNFSISNKLGEGGFGPVYKGKLDDEHEIAVKRLAKTSIQGVDEFKNEVMLIAKLQHRNLVRLLGCCVQGEERMLLYEYMPNRSLDTFLFDKKRAELLDWVTRYRIIVGIARGLLYLHQDSRFRIIHRDLKASNILLDKEMNPKISDFGMARIFGGDESEANTRKVVGTYGYMSPEYAMDGIFSMKSDVFSFGVLILEIISGRRNRGAFVSSSDLNLLGHAWSLWNEGNSLQLVDESMAQAFPMKEVLKCVKLGLLCVQERAEDRPLMSSVILMLGGDNESLPYPKQPGFTTNRVHFEVESSSSKQESRTMNDMTITMFEGR